VSDELWATAHEALESRQKAYGFKRGSARPAGAYDSKYLLTGTVECGVCGGTIVQTWHGRKPAYRCWYNHSEAALYVQMPWSSTCIWPMSQSCGRPGTACLGHGANRHTQGRAHAARERARPLCWGDRRCGAAGDDP